MGWEPCRATAHLHGCEGIRREAFLAELVASRPTIVGSGAHGKTTTSGMIAFALKELTAAEEERIAALVRKAVS